MNLISAENKRKFIEYFLKHYQLKRREGKWVLNYLKAEESHLEKIHFVEDASLCPKGLVFTAHGVESSEFYFYSDGLKSSNIEKVFNTLKREPIDNLYIELNFPHWQMNDAYIEVLEKNPYALDILNLTPEEQLMVDSVIEDNMNAFAVDYLVREIDAALDSADMPLFYSLTDQYNHLLKTKQTHY